MKSTATAQHLPIVEAPLLPPLEAGKLRPWRRGGSLAASAIAKFTPATSSPLDRWIAGAQFRVDVGRGRTALLEVVRYIPEEFVPGRKEHVYVGRGHYETRLFAARTIPELVVVRVITP